MNRQPPDARRWALRSAVENAALGAAIAVSFAWRVWWIPRAPIDPDEAFHAGGADLVGRGMKPVLDFLELKPFLVLKLYSYLTPPTPESVHWVEPLRWLHLGWAVLFAAAVYLTARRAFGPKAGLWAAALLNSFVFYVERSLQARTDLLGLLCCLAGLWLLVSRRDELPSWRRVALAAAAFGTAGSFHVAMAAPAAGVAAWLVAMGVRRRERGRAAALTVLFAAAAAGVHLLENRLLYGAGMWEALNGLWTMIAVIDPAYQRLFDAILFTAIRRETLSASLLLWLTIAAAAGWAAVRSWRGQNHSGAVWLFLMLLLTGVVYNLVENHTFAQRLFFLAVFGAMLTAERLAERPLPDGGRQTRAVAAALALALLAYVGFTFWRAERRQAAEMAATDVRLTTLRQSLAGLGPPEEWSDETVVDWLRERNPSFQPFERLRPATWRERLRFVLAHSRPADQVFTDWNSPPYRDLPMAAHHGFIIYALHTSEDLGDVDRAVALLRRYDPRFERQIAFRYERLLRLLAAKPPALISLEGCMGRVFVEWPEFRGWLHDNYRWMMEPTSLTLYAVRPDRR